MREHDQDYASAVGRASSPYRPPFLSLQPNCAMQWSPAYSWRSQRCCRYFWMAGRVVHTRALSCLPRPRPQQEAARVARDTTCFDALAVTIPVVHADLKDIDMRHCALAFAFTTVCVWNGRACLGARMCVCESVLTWRHIWEYDCMYVFTWRCFWINILCTSLSIVCSCPKIREAHKQLGVTLNIYPYWICICVKQLGFVQGFNYWKLTIL